jgi:Holliday junction resolvase RusA-like endonuclease
MLQFRIFGKPIPQKQTCISKGRFYDPSSLNKKDLQKQFVEAMEREGKPPLKGPVKVTMIFTFAPADYISQKKKDKMCAGKIHHIKKPDIDNLAYLVTNAMKKIVYEDDSQIVNLTLTKCYGEWNNTFIAVTELDECE